jgi:hypothetical protein
MLLVYFLAPIEASYRVARKAGITFTDNAKSFASNHKKSPKNGTYVLENFAFF